MTFAASRSAPAGRRAARYWLFYSLDGGSTYTNVAQLNPDGTSVPNTVGVTHIGDAVQPVLAAG